MLIRGARQKRQSEGKRVAKRLSATPLTDEASIDTSEACRVKTGVPVARIGSSLLLKTSLPRSPVPQRTPRRTCHKYSGLPCPRQRLRSQAAALCSFLDSRRGRTGTNTGRYERLKQSPQRAGRRSSKGNRNLSVKFFGRER